MTTLRTALETIVKCDSGECIIDVGTVQKSFRLICCPVSFEFPFFLCMLSLFPFRFNCSTSLTNLLGPSSMPVKNCCVELGCDCSRGDSIETGIYADEDVEIEDTG